MILIFYILRIFQLVQVIFKQVQLKVIQHVNHLVLDNRDRTKAQIHDCNKLELIGGNQENVFWLPILSQYKKILHRFTN